MTATEPRSEEVAKGLHRIVLPFGDRDNAVHVLVGSGGSMVVDTGRRDDPVDGIAPFFASYGLKVADVRFVLNTHADFDHFGGNEQLKGMAPDAIFLCGEPDRGLIEDVDLLIADRYDEFADEGAGLRSGDACQIRRDTTGMSPDMGLVGGERVLLDDGWLLEIRATPGHSPGSVSVWDPRAQAAIVGDAVLGSGVPTSAGDLAFPPTYRDVDAYLDTVALIGQLRPQLLLASHFPVLEGVAVGRFLEETRAYVEGLDAALMSVLDRGGSWTLLELADEVGPRLGSWPRTADRDLAWSLAGHLERAARRRLVAANPGLDGWAVWATRQ